VRRDQLPILEPPECYFDSIAVLDQRALGFPVLNAGFYYFTVQRISEPVTVIMAVGQQPLGHRIGVVAYSGCGHEKSERATVGVADCMQFSVNAASCTTY
jgi:hypothetical protein